MPASLPGSTQSDNETGNPSAGPFVIFDPLSGPKGSPLDNDSDDNASTGAMCNGIGMESQANIINAPKASFPDPINQAGFDDDYAPGAIPNGANVNNSNMLYIGGGRSLVDANGVPIAGEDGTSPYTAGVLIGGAGQGASRDAGAGPAFTSFPMKMVTASGDVANGADIEAGFSNRTGEDMVNAQSAFGSSDTAQAAPT